MEYILLWILFSVFSGVIAKSRNQDVLLWALVGLFFGPFGLIVAFLPSETEGLQSTSRQAITKCKKCQEAIQFNARICRHCGTHFPYLAEPARSHVELIEKHYVQGASPIQIAHALNEKGIRPATGGQAWNPGTVADIIKGHIS
ncbi:recombinase family protein [uncultured Lamprocystis sp.]